MSHGRTGSSPCVYDFTDILTRWVNYLVQLQTVAKTAGINHEEWLANADRWVAGFLEKFEEHCHNMVSLYMKLETRLPRIRRQPD